MRFYFTSTNILFFLSLSHSHNGLPPRPPLLPFDVEKAIVCALNPAALPRAGLLSLLQAQFALFPVVAAELAGDAH